MVVPDDPPGWPRLGDLDAAVVRLEICRHLLTPLSEQGGQPPSALVAFDEIGQFLNEWTEERVHADAGRFCVETVRMLATLLSHLERGNQLTEAARLDGIAAV
ncbi:MAG: hypothetical protein PGN09_03620 [Sphingomonas fennica]